MGKILKKLKTKNGETRTDMQGKIKERGNKRIELNWYK